MSFRIKRIKKRRGGRRLVELEGGERFFWPAGVVKESDFEEGDEVKIEEFKSRLRSVAAEVLPRKARKYLARYEQSCERFRERFVKKGYPREMVNSLIPELKQEGFLDDRRYAREHVRKRLENNARGRPGLKAELRDRGIEPGLAQKVVEKRVDASDERRMARSYCEENQGLSKRKLASRLESRGFKGSVISDMIDEFAEGEQI